MRQYRNFFGLPKKIADENQADVCIESRDPRSSHSLQMFSDVHVQARLTLRQRASLLLNKTTSGILRKL